MSEQAAAVVETPVTETPVTPVPLGQLESVAEYRERRAKGETGEPVEVPVTPAAKPVETPATEVEPDPASEAGKALAKQKGRAQERIDELTRKNGETERQYRQREAELLAELAALKAGTKPAEGSTEAPKAEGAKEYKRIMALTGAPKVSEFDTYEEFQFAASLFVNDVRSAERDQRQQAESATRGAAEAQGRVYEAAKAAHADVDEVMTSFVNAGHRFAPVVQDVVVNHPLGHEIAYVLAKDPARHAAIAAIKHPGLAMIELGKVIAGIEAGAKPAAKAEPVKKVSSAPAPVEPVTPGETSTGRPDPANITSIATWNKERKNYL
jgi:hypothetical protein